MRGRRGTFGLWLAGTVLLVPLASGRADERAPRAIGSRRELFVDHFLID